MSVPSSRRYDLDWIRVAAFGLLVVFHVGMYYVTWDWHVKSPAAGPGLEPLMMLTAPWRLSLLFLVSGAASAFLFARRPEGYLRERTRRLLLPLVFGMLVIVAPQSYYEVVEKLPGGYHDGFLAFYGRYLAADPGFCRDGDCLTIPTWNHLWFLAYLWVYVLLAWAALRWVPLAVRARIREIASSGLRGLGVLVWPIAWLVAARLLLLDRFGSTHALVGDWYNHAQYLPIFALGFAMARNEAFWMAVHGQRRIALAIAVATYGFLFWYFGPTGYANNDLVPPHGLVPLQRTVWAVNQWTTIVAILGFGQALRHANGRALQYLVPAVLPVYMLHQTVIVVLAHNLQPFGIAPAVEAPLLVVATFAACFAGYEVIRRVTWLRPLFGLRAVERAPASSQVARSQPEAGRP